MNLNGKYNFIYKTLVKDEDDIIGIIAYAFYKRQKIEFIENFITQNGKDPNDNDLKTFHQISNSQSQLESYRASAINLAKEFLEASLAEKANELEEYYEKKANDEIKSTKPKFWFGVSQGVVASFIFVLLTGGIVFFSWSSKLGIKNVIEEVFHVKMTPIEEKPSQAIQPSDTSSIQHTLHD